MTESRATDAESPEIAIRYSFLRVHDAYLEAWREGLRRGDARTVLPYYQHVRSTQYARPGWDALEAVTPETSQAGKQQTIEALRGGTHEFADRAVLVRNDREVVVFFRKTINHDGRRFAAFMMQVWIRANNDDSEWRLARETTEK